MEVSKQLIDAIDKANNVAIFTHVRPDGDCIGSAMALRLALITKGKHVDVYCDGIISNSYNFLKGIDTINNPKLDSYDTGVSVDVAEANRMGIYQAKYNSIATKINVDHHMGNPNFGDINLVDGKRASACEIIYELFLVLQCTIDKDIAECIYVGMATDTGCFQHASVQAVTHIIAADLMQRGADVAYINTRLFKSNTIGQVELKKCALNNMQFYSNNRVCITYLTKSNFIDTNCKPNIDTQGLVDTFIDIDGVDIGVLVSEDKPGICAVSYRSKGKVDVSKLGEYFGGGGHKNAAGCNIFGNAKTGVKKILKAIGEVYAGIY